MTSTYVWVSLPPRGRTLIARVHRTDTGTVTVVHPRTGGLHTVPVERVSREARPVEVARIERLVKP